MKIAIFGASGFSHEVADICFDLGYAKIVFVDVLRKSGNYHDFDVVNENNIEALSAEGYKFAIGIGENAVRKFVFCKFSKLEYVNIVHPSATFGLGQRELMDEHIGNIVAAGVRFTNSIKTSNFGIYNLNSTIGHDCIIEDFVNIAPGVNISGNVTIREESFIGTNACIINGESVLRPLIVGKNLKLVQGSSYS